MHCYYINTLVISILYVSMSFGSKSALAKRNHTSPRKASGIPSLTSIANCRAGGDLHVAHFNKTSFHDSNSTSLHSLETSPVPLTKGSSLSFKLIKICIY